MEIRAAFICWYGNLLTGLASAWCWFPRYEWGFLLSGGLSLWLSGFVLIAYAKRDNPYFIPQLVMPPLIVRHGIYQWLRHPGYTGFLCCSCGAWLAFGAHLLPVPFLLSYLLILWRRVRRENQLLYGA